eukprot:11284537-Prorocentrum_lima.AAC.1
MPVLLQEEREIQNRTGGESVWYHCSLGQCETVVDHTVLMWAELVAAVVGVKLGLGVRQLLKRTPGPTSDH